MRNRELLFIIKVQNLAKRQLRGLQGDLRQTARAARETAKATSAVQQQTKNTARNLNQTSKAAQGLTGNIKKLVSQLGPLAGALSIGAVLTRTVQQTVAFETALSRVVGLVGVAQKEVDGFRDVLLDLGAETAKGPAELADALFFVTSAGLRGQQAIDVLEKSAKAATAGLGETKTVADALTSALNAYAPSGLTAAEATDILVATVREGKLEASELAGVLGQILPIATEAGVRLDEVGGVVASLTRIGLPASEAITGLRGVLVALTKETETGKKVLAALGTSFADLRAQIREEGLIKTLQDLRARLGDNETALADIFGRVEAANAVLGLTGSQADIVDGIFRRLADSSGALDDAFDAASSTAEFKLRAALASLDATLIRLGSVVLPPVAAALKLVADNLLLVAAAVAVLFRQQIASFFLGIIGPASAAAKAFLAVAFSVRGLTIALRALPLVAIASVVSGLFLSAWENLNKEVAEGVTQWTLITAVFTEFFRRIQRLGGAGIDLLSKLGKLIANPFKAAATVGEIKKAAEELGTAFTEVFDGTVIRTAVESEAIRSRKLREALAAEQTKQNAEQAGAEVGDAAGRGVQNAFLAAVEQLGGFDKFSNALNKIIAQQAPAIAAAQAQAEALKVLDAALLLSDEQLADFGLTQESLAKIIAKTRQEVEGEATSIEKAIEAANERIRLLGFEKEERKIQIQLSRARAQALKDEGEVDEEALKLLEKRLRAEKLLVDQEAAIDRVRKQRLKDLKKTAEEETSDLGRVAEDAFSRIGDAITEFAETGKFNFRDFVNSALSDLQRLASRQIVSSLSGAFTGGGGGQDGGGGGGFLASIGGFISGLVAHDGAVVGKSGTPMIANARLFANARRYHRGGRVGPREVPIIAQRGETVLTEEQSRTLGNALQTRSVGRVGPSTNAQATGGRDPLEAQQNNITVAINVQTPDVEGFRRSAGQIGKEIAASTNRAFRRNG